MEYRRIVHKVPAAWTFDKHTDVCIIWQGGLPGSS